MEGHEAGSRYVWQRAGMSGDPPGWGPLEDDLEEEVEERDPALKGDLDALSRRLEEVDIMSELLGRLERKITCQAWTVWEAFSGFAQEWLEVEPEKLIKAQIEDVLSGVEDLKARRERLGVEADEEHLRRYVPPSSIPGSAILAKKRGSPGNLRPLLSVSTSTRSATPWTRRYLMAGGAYLDGQGLVGTDAC